MFFLWSVRLSVCRQITENFVNGFRRTFLGGVGHGPGTKGIGPKFWRRSGSPSISRSPKSKIQIHWIIEKLPSGLRSKLHS